MACPVQLVELETMWLLEKTTGKHAPTPVAQALVQPTTSQVLVHLRNMRTEPLMLYAGMELAMLDEVEAARESVSTVKIMLNMQQPLAKKRYYTMGTDRRNQPRVH